MGQIAPDKLVRILFILFVVITSLAAMELTEDELEVLVIGAILFLIICAVFFASI